jgi:hypothetical protein
MKSVSARFHDLTMNPMTAYRLMEQGEIASVTPTSGTMSTERGSTVDAPTTHPQVLIDACDGGHHLSWMVDFCIAFLDTEPSVIAFFPNPEALRERVLSLRPDCAERFKTRSTAHLFEDGKGRSLFGEARSVVQAWTRLQRTLDDLPVRPKAVFFPYLDEFLARGLNPQLLDHIFRFPWSGLYMSPTWMRRRRRFRPGLQTSPGWVLRSKNCLGVALLDEDLVPRLRHLLPGKAVISLPDFLPSDSEQIKPRQVESIRQRAGDRTIVGVVGSLQSRKGISTLLRVALTSPDAPFFFVFAGSFSFANFSPEERTMWAKVIEQAPDNCHIYPHAIEGEQGFADLANTCDLFYAAYHDFPNSSNTLTWAAWLEKPVIVSAGYLMEQRVRRFLLGAVIPQNDEIACREALDTLRNEQLAGEKRDYGFAAYLAEHSKSRLREGIATFQQLPQT